MGKYDLKSNESATHSAKQIIHALIGILKTLTLYSESHPVYKNSLIIMKKLINVHFDRFGNFRIQIERRNVLYKDEILYEGGSEPSDLVFLLHRDGIQWLEFQNGLDLWEIDTFFKIIHDHIVLDEDPEDDIVTALWAVNLPSILYRAAYPEMGLQDADLCMVDLPYVVDQNGKCEKKDKAQGHTETIYPTFATNVLTQDGHEELWQLNADERKQLQKMIADEEELDGSDYVIDALLYILKEHCLEEDITELLDSLMEEMQKALIHARFRYVLEAHVRIKKDIINNFPQSHWVVPYLKRFLACLATKPFLNGLQSKSVNIQDVDDEQLEYLKRFLLMLDSSVISVIGPMMLNIQSAKLQRIILETIGTMAMSNFRPLEKLIYDGDPVLAGRLVFLLGHLKDERSRQTLSKLLGHPSELVRRPALQAILYRDDKEINEIFPLINDSDEIIRKLVFKRLGRKRCKRIEHKLLEYLKSYGPKGNNDAHFIAVCRTLGRCGSKGVIPYLTHMLYRWPRMGVLRSVNSLQRQGAVVALKEMNTKIASALIDRNNRGFLGNVFRSALPYST